MLQLVAGRYLAPFIGSSVETWTSVIGIFLTGIALGNWLGGKLADKAPSTRTLAILLVLGALGSLAMIGWYYVCISTGFYRSIPLQLRIPVLAALFCLLPAFTLSLITPLTIKLILPDVTRAGGIAGLIFALSTLGCLLGNYATGFWLLADYTLDTITWGVGISLLVLSIPTFLMRHSVTNMPKFALTTTLPSPTSEPVPQWLDFRSNIRLAYGLVFLSSFCGMSLELTASRVLAPKLGVSLFTWTGIIGVMLAGTAFGNFIGGIIADRLQRRRPQLAEVSLSLALLIAGSSLIVVVIVPSMLYKHGFLGSYDVTYRVLGWTFVLFFVPMFMLGTVSPQVIRLSVTDLQHTGRVAGSIYAWSTIGAIAGTFTTGYFLISAIGSNRVLLVIAFLLTILAFFAGQLWKRHTALYGASLIAGGALCGLVVMGNIEEKYDLETKYYAILVKDFTTEDRIDWASRVKLADRSLAALANAKVPEPVIAKLMPWKDQEFTSAEEFVAALSESLDEKELNEFQDQILTHADWIIDGKVRPHLKKLSLDHLVHSYLDLDDPTWLGYKHEEVQGELLRYAASRNEPTHLLVIGGGGYTFPRWVEYMLPEVHNEVVEIDPGVTQVARSNLGLSPDTIIISHHMDGRQFIAERAQKGHYQLVMQDAVNDLSVPYHLMTKEYNDAVKATLTNDGAYLLTLIDSLEYGKLWRASVNTLRESFKNVVLLFPREFPTGERAGSRAVYVIYASDAPLELEAIQKAVAAHQSGYFWTHALSTKRLDDLLAKSPKLILTDQYAPVDNLMSEIFRRKR